MTGVPRLPRLTVSTLARTAVGRLVAVSLATTLLACLTAATTHAHHQPEGDENHSVLTLGRVSGSPRQHFPALEALGMYLAPRLADQGITGFDVVLTPDNEQMVESLRRGIVDLVTETAFSALEFELLAGAQPFLRQWKGGAASYRSLFITRSESGIDTLDGLVGRVVAFEDPGSTSGFFVPWSTLVRRGLRVVPDEGRAQTDAVRYVFAGNEENVLAWVTRERADAGAVSSRDWDDPKRAPPGLKQHLRVVYESPPIIRSLLLVRKGMPAELRSRLAEILLAMHEDPAGQPVLKQFFKTTRFDRLEGEALADLRFARSLFAEYRGKLMAREP